MAELIDKGALIKRMKYEYDLQDLYLPITFIELAESEPTTTEAEIRAKAIDEFANAVANYIENATTEGVENLLFMARSTVLKEIAEQLKQS